MIHFDIPNLRQELSKLEQQTVAEGFWNNQETSNKILAQIKNIKSKTIKYKELENEVNNILELIELVQDTVLENYNVDMKCEQEFVNWE